MAGVQGIGRGVLPCLISRAGTFSSAGVASETPAAGSFLKYGLRNQEASPAFGRAKRNSISDTTLGCFYSKAI